MTHTTPDMDLVLPDVLMTAGPGYAYLLNAAMLLVDSHDHSTGKGVQVTPAGLNISSDLTFSQNNATNLRTARLFNNTTFTPLTADKTCLYALNGELYYIDAAGNNVQITLSGALDLSSGLVALTIKDNNLIIENNADTTKQFKFSAANLTTSTSYTFSFPATTVSDTFVLAAASQTLTNKTLTAPVINSPTGIVKADVGLGNVDNTSDATKNSAAVILTNKTMGSTNTLTGVKIASFTSDGTDTITVPTGASDTIALLAASQTLTNKTFDSTSTMTGVFMTNIATGGGHIISFPATTNTVATLLGSETLLNKTIGNTVVQSGNFIRFNNTANTFYTTLQAGTNTANVTFQLPIADGSSGNILQTDGAGNLSFVANAGSTQATATTLGVVKGGTVPGQISGSAVAAGYLGEEIRSTVTAGAAPNFPASTTYGDLMSISLSAGVWSISFVAELSTPGVAGFTSAIFGISTTTGNSAAGLVRGDNQIGVASISLQDSGVTLPSYIVSVSATSTYYLKYSSTYTTNTPYAWGRLSAVRVG